MEKRRASAPFPRRPDDPSANAQPTRADSAAESERPLTGKHENRDRLNEIQEIARIGYWEYDVVTGRTSWSREIFRLLKMPCKAARLTFEDFLHLYPATDSARLKTLLHQAMKGNSRYELDLDFRPWHGETARHRCTILPAANAEGLVTGVHGYLQDISDFTLTEPVPVTRRRDVHFVAVNTRDVLFRVSLPDGIYEFISPSVHEVTGHESREWYRNPFLIMDILHPEWHAKFRKEFDKVLRGSAPDEHIFPIIHKSGEMRWIHLRTTILREYRGDIVAVEGIASDITERKKEEAERKQLIRELKKALSEVKTLSGLLPICSHCKKVRDDTGYWKQIESFITEHSDLFFTHGLCPECLLRYYPEYALKPPVRDIKANPAVSTD